MEIHGSYLEDNGRQCGLVVPILVGFRLCFFAPVLLVCFQCFPQPANDVGLEVWHHEEGKGGWVLSYTQCSHYSAHAAQPDITTTLTLRGCKGTS